jgi:hypothetical protein
VAQHHCYRNSLALLAFLVPAIIDAASTLYACRQRHAKQVQAVLLLATQSQVVAQHWWWWWWWWCWWWWQWQCGGGRGVLAHAMCHPVEVVIEVVAV